MDSGRHAPSDLMTSDPIHSRLQAIQNEMLEMIAYSEPLAVVARLLCERIEEIAPEAVCSILTVDSGGHLHPIASPSSPDELHGEARGHCNRTLGRFLRHGRLSRRAGAGRGHRNRSALGRICGPGGAARPQGLLGATDQGAWRTVIGTFALYYRTNRGPNACERSGGRCLRPPLRDRDRAGGDPGKQLSGWPISIH